MIRLTKVTDYALVLMAYMARHRERELFTARDLAESTGIPLPMVSKILKTLTRDEYLHSTRGVGGGYSLARPAEEISVAGLIEHLEGPVSLTECSMHSDSTCSLEANCPVSHPLQRINRVVIDVLSGITLAQLAEPEDARVARR